MTKEEFEKKHGHEVGACCLIGRCGAGAKEDGWAITRAEREQGWEPLLVKANAALRHPDEAVTAMVACKPGKGFGVTTDKGHWGGGKWILGPSPTMHREQMVKVVEALKTR